ncbi:PIN domain-containing protein [Hyphomonas pacifica]|uniref:DUF4935 domain-containing protein n=1 Tax=Hyphomonas pacifica TaxID=1280941 RepID=A0A062TY21_9PROT|nr:PIN domain-containing protein [Hyphomonas pacifica]KCZ50927.1 hypothetical protein HY2_13040 [Hyphomonas pacifica]RAN33440.1 hypothetical protein HY3_12880 [Hyphomonas pacifica]
MTVHVFVDTNIFLTFFHYSQEDLDSLNNVFASHEHGAATVYLTEQVVNEFLRNREAKIADALKRFEDSISSIQLPAFLKGYAEFSSLKNTSTTMKQLKKAVLEKVQADIAASSLPADLLISSIIKNAAVINISDDAYSAAKKSVQLGNPPGKNGSLGDAVNWQLLLSKVPDGEDIHIISEDGDYFSKLDLQAPHPFLAEKWKEAKKSNLHVYRSISKFLKVHFDGTAFSFDKNKEELIEKLRKSGSFATTHSTISKLEDYSYFSLPEVTKLLDAIVNNPQVNWIWSDADVWNFYKRVTLPRINEITQDDHKQMLELMFVDKPQIDSTESLI